MYIRISKQSGLQSSLKTLTRGRHFCGKIRQTYFRYLFYDGMKLILISVVFSLQWLGRKWTDSLVLDICTFSLLDLKLFSLEKNHVNTFFRNTGWRNENKVWFIWPNLPNDADIYTSNSYHRFLCCQWKKVHSRDAVPANSSYSKHLSTDHEDVPSDDDGKKGMVARITCISLVLYLSLSVSQEFYT